MARRSILVTILFASALAACGSAQASELGATCDEFAKTPAIAQTAEATAGDDLTIVLCSNATTGYSWGPAAVSDTAVATVSSQEYSAPAQASLPIVGQAGGEVVKVHAAAPGTATVKLDYGRPWDPTTSGTWTYQLTLTVK